MTALREAALPGVAGARPRLRLPWGPLVPALLFLAVVFAYPVLQLLWLSVVDRSGALTGTHYTRLFAAPVYVQVLLITFRIAAWTTALCLLGGYPVAYLLATAGARWRGALTLLVLLPFWTSFLVRTFAWIVLLGRNGAVNGMLRALGVTDAPAELIYNFTGVMIGMTHALMPLAVLTMLAVMESIDPNLGRAASTLGARGGQAFWRVYFPLSLPGVAAAGLLVFITALGFFITPALLGGPRQMMVSNLIEFSVRQVLNWPFAFALANTLLIGTLLLYAIYIRVVEGRMPRTAGLP